MFKPSLIYSGASLWNSLPPTLKSIQRLNYTIAACSYKIILTTVYIPITINYPLIIIRKCAVMLHQIRVFYMPIYYDHNFFGFLIEVVFALFYFLVCLGFFFWFFFLVSLLMYFVVCLFRVI